MTDYRRRLVEVEDDPGPAPRPRVRFGLWAAVGLGVVAATVVLFSTRDSGIEAAPSTTTTITPATLGTVATPTTVVEPGAPPRPTETSLGKLVWAEAEFDTPLLPQGEIQVDPLLGGYVIHSYDANGTWRSSDGLTWARDDAPSPFGDAAYVYYLDEFAIVDPGRIFEARNGEWLEVSLKAAAVPDIDELDWATYPGTPVRSADRTLIPVSVVGTIRWGDIYGTDPYDCGEPEPCQAVPWAGESGSSEMFEVYHPETGASIATIRASVSGPRVVLTDVSNEEVVYEIGLESRQDARQFIDDITQDGTWDSPGLLIVTDDGHEFHSVPWAGYANVRPTDTGFVAFENFDYPGGTLEEPPRIWHSEDGRSWDDSGTVDFLPDRYQYMQVQSVSGQLVARVVTDLNPANGENGFEEWVSSDGMNWSQRESVLPAEAWIQKADYGYMATGWVGFGPRFWVSGDGENWEDISLPRALATESAYYGTAGDLIYHSSVASNGLGTLWIGRFIG
jgi:hypothetical protein